jgi:putative transposase
LVQIFITNNCGSVAPALSINLRTNFIRCSKVIASLKRFILQAVYFELRFSLSYRDVEELLSTRRVTVDHASIQRWVYKFTPLIEEGFRRRKKLVISSWRMDETYIKVKEE